MLGSMEKNKGVVMGGKDIFGAPIVGAPNSAPKLEELAVSSCDRKFSPKARRGCIPTSHESISATEKAAAILESGLIPAPLVAAYLTPPPRRLRGNHAATQSHPAGSGLLDHLRSRHTVDDG
jgi:hypothetical protein